MLCSSKDVPKMSLCSGTTSNYTWRLGNTLIHWSHVLKLSLTARIWVTFSLGISHNTGMEQLSLFLPGHMLNFLAAFGTVNLYLQHPLLVVSNLMLFLFLCQTHKLLMRPKCWKEACSPDTQVQPFLHKYKSLYHGALLSCQLKCKALKGEVQEFLEKLSYKEDNNMRRNAPLITKHTSATDRQRDR